MKKIKRLVKALDVEVSGAENYAECFAEKRIEGSKWADAFRKMANDELTHAEYLHQMAVEEIEKAKQIYTPPVSMEDAWNRSHKEYIERVAVVKTMLSM